MTEAEQEFAWEDEKDLVHLAIVSGAVNLSDNTVQSDELFTVCGIDIPDGAILMILSEADVTCAGCLEGQYGDTVDEFIQRALKPLAVA